VRRLSRNPLFRGIRIRGVGNKTVEQGVEDSAWLRDLNLLADHDLSLDIANWSGTVPQMTRLAAALPSLRMVVNHIAGLRVDGQPPPPQFIEELGRAARHSNIYCKISGLAEATGARNGTAPTDPEYYKPTIDAFWDTLGEDRLIYGSNWPVCEWAASYATVFGIVDAYFTSKGSAARRKFFAGNARHAYKWVPRT
jgi:L-fuconolactonase